MGARLYFMYILLRQKKWNTYINRKSERRREIVYIGLLSSLFVSYICSRRWIHATNNFRVDTHDQETLSNQCGGNNLAHSTASQAFFLFFLSFIQSFNLIFLFGLFFYYFGSYKTKNICFVSISKHTNTLDLFPP